MESQLKVSFILVHSKSTKTKKTPLYLRIRYNYKHVTIATGFQINAGDWDKKSMKVKGNTAEIRSINDGLKSLDVKVRSVVNQLILIGKPFSVYNVKELVTGISKTACTLNEAFDSYLKMIKDLEGKDYTATTYTKYRQTHDRVKEFFKLKYNRSDFYLYDLDDTFLMDFEKWLKTDIGNNQTTVYKHWQRLTRIVRYAVKRKMVDTYPFSEYSIKLPKKKVEYLTKEEVDLIESKDFGSDRLNVIRDLFIFSCYTGLAYTEVANLSEQHIVKGIDGQLWIQMVRQKVKREFGIPILPQALALIEKYRNLKHEKNSGKIFPIPSNAKYNAYLKEIQEVCKIKILLTVHLARKTFSITTCLLNGVSIPVLSKLLAHSSARVTMEAYAAVLPEMVIKEFEMVKQKLNK